MWLAEINMLQNVIHNKVISKMGNLFVDRRLVGVCHMIGSRGKDGKLPRKSAFVQIN